MVGDPLPLPGVSFMKDFCPIFKPGINVLKSPSDSASFLFLLELSENKKQMKLFGFHKVFHFYMISWVRCYQLMQMKRNNAWMSE